MFPPRFEVGTSAATPRNSDCPQQGHDQTLSSRAEMAHLKGELKSLMKGPHMRCGQQNGNQQGMEKLSGLGIVGNQYHCQGWRTRGGSQDWSCMRGTATGTKRQSELWPQEDHSHCQSTARKRGSRRTHFLHPLSPPNSWSLASDSYWPNLIRSQRVGSPGLPFAEVSLLRQTAGWKGL